LRKRRIEPQHTFMLAERKGVMERDVKWFILDPGDLSE
jgi:hypothetical protein